MRRILTSLTLSSLLVTGFLVESPALATRSIWKPIGRFISSGATDDAFGFDIDIDDGGDTVAVSAPFGADTGGEIRIYDLTSSSATWVQRGSTITGVAGDALGVSIDLTADGNTIAVASPFNVDTDECPEIGADGCDPSSYVGIVRVFDWDGTDWRQRGEDLIGDGESTFAWSIALSDDGDTIVVGSVAPWDADGYKGVSVFDWAGGVWSQYGDDLAETDGSYPGLSVTVSDDGNTIGFPVIVDLGSGGPDDSGLIAVYDRTDTGWGEPSLIEIDNQPPAFATIPWSLSMSDDGTTVAFFVASIFDEAPFFSSAVTVFDRRAGGDDWTQRGRRVPAFALTLEAWGTGLSLSGDGSTFVTTDSTVELVGPGVFDPSSIRGYVRVYDWSGEEWARRGGGIETDRSDVPFPFSVAISGNSQRVAVSGFAGVFTDDESSGSAGVYEWGSAPAPGKVSVSFDPAGGTCNDKTTPWTITKRGAINLPAAEQCTRPGHVLLGWTTNPTRTAPEELLHTVIARPGTLTAVWGAIPPAPAGLTAIPNFGCDNCGTTLLVWQQPASDTTVTNFQVTVDNTPVDCPAIAWGDWWACNITTIDPNTPHTYTVRAVGENGSSPPHQHHFTPV